MEALLVLLVAPLPVLPHSLQATDGEAIQWNDELVYHALTHSFRDSNGDGCGDLRGLIQGLDYMQELGVTTVLPAPLYASEFHHKYFPTDYEVIDPAYGSKDDWRAFVSALHARDMKLILDMETRYMQSGGVRYEDSCQNPGSNFSDFIHHSDEANGFPEQFFVPSGSPPRYYKAWPDKQFAIAHLDLNHPRVKEYMKNYCAWWVDC